MRRRTFVASGLGLVASAAGQGLVSTVMGDGVLAQTATAPPIARNAPQGKWIRLAPFPQATGELLGVALNGKLYAAQGLLPGFKPAGLVYEYDPASDAWALEARTPTARSGSAGAAYQGKIYVVGGEYQNDEVMMAFRAFDAYDPATNRWERLPHMLAPRHGLAAALLGSRLHAAGGDFQSAGVPGVQPHLDSHEVFDFAKW